MPCGDITEVIAIELNDADELTGYRLNKRTCGAEIGRESLLLDLFAGRTPESILALTGEDVLGRYAMPEAEEFLYFKHLVAMQQALEVLTGLAQGGPGEACTAAEIIADGRGMHFVGHIAVDLLTDKIKACGNCGSCGARQPSRSRPAPAAV